MKKSKHQMEKHERSLAISAKELAEKLSISPRTVWRLLAENKLPKPVSIGGSKRFLMSDVNLFMECGCDMDAYRARTDKKNAKE